MYEYNDRGTPIARRREQLYRNERGQWEDKEVWEDIIDPDRFEDRNDPAYQPRTAPVPFPTVTCSECGATIHGICTYPRGYANGATCKKCWEESQYVAVPQP